MTGFYSEALKPNHQLTLDLGANVGNVMFYIMGCLGQKGQPSTLVGQDTFREDPFSQTWHPKKITGQQLGKSLGGVSPHKALFLKAWSAKLQAMFLCSWLLIFKNEKY